MVCRRPIIAGLVLLLLAAEGRAQVVFPVFGGPGYPTILPNGFAFRYRSGSLSVGGFVGSGYGAGFFYPGYPFVFPPQPLITTPVPYLLPTLQVTPTYNISYNVITPRVVMVPGPTPPLTSAYDLSGVDLDLVPLAGAGAKKPALARDADRQPPQKPGQLAAAKVPAPAQVAAPAAAKKVVAAGVRLEDLPEFPRAEQPAPAKNIDEEYYRLLEQGTKVFRQGAYGLAAQRFEQAMRLQPKTGRAYFYLAQAYVALGKFQEAAELIEQGLEKQPDWPRTAFEPRVDFYRELKDDWLLHAQRLEEASRRDPEQFALLFLMGYQKWFSGQRAEAVMLLNRARPLAADPATVDAFLKAPQAAAAN